jgi:flagellar hook-associated protein 2
VPAVDGIVSGIDTTAMINAIVGVVGTQKIVMQNHLVKLNQQKSAVAGLSSKLSALSAKIKEMDTADEFTILTATPATDTQFDISLSSDAAPGRYAIKVVQTAAAETEVSQGFADESSSGIIQQGTLSITYGGTTTPITVDSTNDSLEGLAEAIDNIDGLTSYVLDTGDGSGSPYKLVIQGEDTGATNGITIDTSGLSGGGTAPTLTQVVEAADAHIQVNGVDVYDTDNSITAIPGITITAKTNGSSAVDVNVAKNTSAIESKVNEFITAYNDVVNYYKTYTVYNSDANIKGGLVGDGSARRIIDGLGTMLTAQYPTTESLDALSKLGVQTTQDGTLKLDSDDFQAALTSDYAGVQALFTDATGPLQTIQTKIDDVYVDTTNGTLQLRTDTLESSIKDTQENIDDFDKYLKSYSERLRKQFTAMEIAMGEMQSTQAYLAGVFGDGSRNNN